MGMDHELERTISSYLGHKHNIGFYPTVFDVEILAGPSETTLDLIHN